MAAASQDPFPHDCPGRPPAGPGVVPHLAVQWPEQGVPANPRAWLLTVASRRLRAHLLEMLGDAAAARVAGGADGG